MFLSYLPSKESEKLGLGYGPSKKALWELGTSKARLTKQQNAISTLSFPLYPTATLL